MGSKLPKCPVCGAKVRACKGWPGWMVHPAGACPLEGFLPTKKWMKLCALISKLRAAHDPDELTIAYQKGFQDGKAKRLAVVEQKVKRALVQHDQQRALLLHPPRAEGRAGK